MDGLAPTLSQLIINGDNFCRFGNWVWMRGVDSVYKGVIHILSFHIDKPSRR